jgi:hypothetical protein
VENLEKYYSPIIYSTRVELKWLKILFTRIKEFQELMSL